MCLAWLPDEVRVVSLLHAGHHEAAGLLVVTVGGGDGLGLAHLHISGQKRWTEERVQRRWSEDRRTTIPAQIVIILHSSEWNFLETKHPALCRCNKPNPMR